MSHYPASILRLISHFSRLPGIGEKTAERLAMHVLRAPKKEAEGLAAALVDLKETVRLCSRCFGLSDAEVCRICNDPARDPALVCVVEQPAEMVAIERAGGFRGTYHILQGTLSPMNGVGPEEIRIKELLERVAHGGATEIVLATGTSVEGEATASYIAECLKPFPVKITRIASGVPIGGDLKFVDGMTLKRAMETRYVL
jgi:recombination protein RecR